MPCRSVYMVSEKTVAAGVKEDPLTLNFRNVSQSSVELTT